MKKVIMIVKAITLLLIIILSFIVYSWEINIDRSVEGSITGN